MESLDAFLIALVIILIIIIVYQNRKFFDKPEVKSKNTFASANIYQPEDDSSVIWADQSKNPWAWADGFTSSHPQKVIAAPVTEHMYQPEDEQFYLKYGFW